MWSSTVCLTAGMLVGGTKNIVRIINCFTRVHIQVRDLEKITEETKARLGKLPMVKGILIRGDEIQLIIGVEAVQITKDLNKHLGFYNDKTSII